jgi:hypothetical protein
MAGPVCLLIQVPGGTLEQYDDVMSRLEASGGHLGEGQTFHVCGPTAGSFTVIDVWNSREDFDRFLAGRLGQAIQEAKVPPPQITEIPIHNQVGGASSN